MKIFCYGKWRPPKCPAEYFAVLYCERRKIKCRGNVEEHGEAWKSLSPAEQKVFIDKFEKWQAENDKKITSFLEHAEPFFKKRATKKKGNNPAGSNPTKDAYNDDQQQSRIYGDLSNTNLEVSKLENLNIEFFMDDYDDQSESMMNLVYDDSSCINSEAPQGPQGPKPYYAASVIDPDIDEPPPQEETNKTRDAALPEPTPVSVCPREMFEIIQRSGTRPELDTVDWKTLPAKDKRIYVRAATKMRKEYLTKYEKYLESLPSPELFKHYIKIKSQF